MASSSQVESIFFAALEKKDAAERAEYLDQDRGGDTALRLRVDKLLECHPLEMDFLAQPAVERPVGDALDPEPYLPGVRPDQGLMIAVDGRAPQPDRLVDILTPPNVHRVGDP
jgi:hypothetical protein